MFVFKKGYPFHRQFDDRTCFLLKAEFQYKYLEDFLPRFFVIPSRATEGSSVTDTEVELLLTKGRTRKPKR